MRKGKTITAPLIAAGDILGPGLRAASNVNLQLSKDQPRSTARCVPRADIDMLVHSDGLH